MHALAQPCLVPVGGEGVINKRLWRLVHGLLHYGLVERVTSGNRVTDGSWSG